MISKATIGPSASSASQALGCSWPNQPTTFFGPNCSVAERPGWRKAGPPGATCAALATPRAERSAIASLLASNASTPPPPLQCRPSPPAFARPRRTAAAATRWSFSPGAEEDLPDLEQRDVVQRPAGIAFGRGDEAGDEARAHVRQVGGDRVGERERRPPLPEQLGRGLRDEGPGHRLAQRQGGQRAPGEASALLQRRQHRRGHPVVEAGQRRHRGSVDADDAQDLLDDVGLHLDVRPPGRHADPAVLDAEAEPGQDRLALLARNVDADQAPDLAVGKVDRPLRRGRVARDDHPRRLAAADLEHELGREIAAGNAEVGIDAALEAVARVGDDAEPAAGLGDVGRVPQRAFDQHVAGLVVAARVLAAHDSGDRTRRPWRRR